MSFDYSHFSSIIRHIPHGNLAFTLSKKGLKEKKISEVKSRTENVNGIVQLASLLKKALAVAKQMQLQDFLVPYLTGVDLFSSIRSG